MGDQQHAAALQAGPAAEAHGLGRSPPDGSCALALARRRSPDRATGGICGSAGQGLVSLLVALSVALSVAVAVVVVSGWGEGGGDQDGGPGWQLPGGLHGQDRPGLLVAVWLPGHADVQAFVPQLLADCRQRLPGQGGRADLGQAP